MNELHKSRPWLWTLFGLLSLAWLSMLGYRALVPPDEGVYAEMARAMWLSRDWVGARLNGIGHLGFPPLQTWINVLTFDLFGLGQWQVRLWTGLCALGGVLMAAWTGCRLFGRRSGVYAAMVLGSSFFWVVSGQVNSLDTGYATMLALSLCSLLLAQRDEATGQARLAGMLGFWTGMVLALLSKGIGGVLIPLATLCIYAGAARDGRMWRRLHAGPGLLLAAAIAAPWFYLVADIRPGLAIELFSAQLGDYTDFARAYRGPWYASFVMLLVGSVPWVGVLLQSLRLGLRKEAGDFKPRRLLLVWVLVTFALACARRDGAAGDVLPLFPALAMLVGVCFEEGERRSRLFAAGLHAWIGIALLAFVPFMTTLYSASGDAALLVAFQPWVIAAGFCALFGGAFALMHARQMRRDLAVLTLALSGFAMTEMLFLGFEPYGRERAGVALLPAVRAELAPHTRIVTLDIDEPALSWYLEQQLVAVAVDAHDDFRRQWRHDAQAGKPALAVMRGATFELLRKEGLPMREVARDARRVVVANR